MPQGIWAKAVAASAVFYLACCLGCANSNLLNKSDGASKSSAESADARPAAVGELPPKQAARACMVAAEELQNAGHLPQAIQLYEKARANDPNLKGISHRLAVLYQAQGDSTKALIEFNRAIEEEPKNSSLLSDLGFYHYERGNLDEAEQDLRKALAIDPKHQKATSNLALVLAQQGRVDESFAAFSKVVGPAAAHSNLGVLLAKQGRYEEARREFRHALAADATLEQPKAFLKYLENRQPGGDKAQMTSFVAPSSGKDVF